MAKVQILVASQIWLQINIIGILESRAQYPVNFLAVREKVSKAAKSSQISAPASPNAFKTVGLFSNQNVKEKKIRATCWPTPYFPTHSPQPARKVGPLGRPVIHLLQINTYTKCAFFHLLYKLNLKWAFAMIYKSHAFFNSSSVFAAVLLDRSKNLNHELKVKLESRTSHF